MFDESWIFFGRLPHERFKKQRYDAAKAKAAGCIGNIEEGIARRNIPHIYSSIFKPSDGSGCKPSASREEIEQTFGWMKERLESDPGASIIGQCAEGYERTGAGMAAFFMWLRNPEPNTITLPQINAALGDLHEMRSNATLAGKYIEAFRGYFGMNYGVVEAACEDFSKTAISVMFGVDTGLDLQMLNRNMRRFGIRRERDGALQYEM